LIQRVLGVLDGAQDLPHARQQLRTGLGDEQILSMTLEQGQTDIGLQFLDVHGNARLREMQLLCGSRKRAMTRCRLEHAQLAQRGML
jgi:hypothetical protein